MNRRLIDRNANIKCPFCNHTEDELHFLSYCKLYEEIREKYISKHFDNLLAVNLGQLLNNNNKSITTDVAVYAQKAFVLRAQTLREMKERKRINRNQQAITITVLN